MKNKDKTIMVPCWIEKGNCHVVECNQICRPQKETDVRPNSVKIGHISNKKK